MQTVIIQYKDLTRWDIKNYLWLFRSSFSVEPLGKYIYEHSEKQKIGYQADKEFPILGVTNKIGVYLNEYVKSERINQPYKKVKGGELTYNPYRVNVGSIGIVPDEYDNFYISPAYVVFGTKEGLLNEYIYLVLSSSWFNPYLRAATSGSVRQNLTLDLLSELNVPIPPLPTQKKIVEEWHKVRKQAEGLNKKAEEQEKEIDDFILRELGVEKKEYEKKKGEFVIWSKDLERWDTYFYREDFFDLNKQFEKLNFDYLGKKAVFVSRPWNKNSFPSGVFNYVQISDVNKQNGIYNCEEVAVNEAPSRATQIIQKDDVLISTTRPYLAAFAKVNDNFNGCVASSGFSVIEKTTEDLDKDYLLEFLKSYAGIKQLEQRMTGASYPAITQEELGKIKIPLPPLPKQKQIAKKVEKMRAGIQEIKNTADEILKQVQNKIGDMLTG
ncbi:MAG: restriction endonuclease subunit S [Candidatus Buchananbacteria bacterium]